MGSVADTTPFSSLAEERSCIELFAQERKYIQFGAETRFWITTMKILQQYLDHGPRSHWPNLRSIRNRASITHQWYAVQMMQMEGPQAAIGLLRSEGADLPSSLLEFVFAAGVQKNFGLIDEIFSVASAETIELHPDDIVKTFYWADLAVACKLHKRAFWDPRLRVLVINHVKFLDRELRNQYANLSSLQRCLDMYAHWITPGAPNIARDKIPESQCSLCSRYPYHSTAEFHDGDGTPAILPQSS
ncbi:hypothetical protein ACEPPN_014047 [Leptodophora sp. 'Broadleaf-Isolate-01']